jgi:hypothetical protein
MFRSIGIKIIASIAVLALAVSALVALGTNGGGAKTPAILHPAATEAPLTVTKEIKNAAELGEAVSSRLRAHDNVGPHVVTEAAGLDPRDAVLAFALQTGQHLGVVSGNGVKCIVGMSGVVTMADHCYTPEQIETVTDVAIYNACGTTEANVMEITGFAPTGVTAVRLKFSNGSAQDTDVVTEGAFKFDGTTPTSSNNAPYPASIVWLNASGTEVAAHKFPVSGADLCPGD